MNGNKYLADTNTLIYLLQKLPAIEPLLDHEWSYSFISEIEMLGKPGLLPNEEKIIKDLFNTAFKVTCNEDIIKHAIEIKRKYRLKTPDAIIAGTAMFLDVPLITADRDFIKVESMDIILLEV